MKTPFIEPDCTFTAQGRSFTAGGAYVTDERAIAYPKLEREYVGARGDLTDWHGNVIGKCVVTAMWRTPRSYVSSHMLQIAGTIDGRKYTGRGAGNGMVWKGKRTK